MEVFLNGKRLSEHDIPSTTSKRCQYCGKFGENTLLLNNCTTCFCDECFEKMGMVLDASTGVYVCTGKDDLFVNKTANVPSCPFYNPVFGMHTPNRFLKILAADDKFCADLNESLLGSFYDSEQDTSFPDACNLKHGKEQDVADFYQHLTKTELKLLILQGSVWPPKSKKGRAALASAGR